MASSSNSSSNSSNSQALEVSSHPSNSEASRKEVLVNPLSRTSSLHSLGSHSSRHLPSRHRQPAAQVVETPLQRHLETILSQPLQAPIHLPLEESKSSSQPWLRASWEMMMTSQSASRSEAKRRSKRHRLSLPRRKRRPRRRLTRSSATRENLHPSSSWTMLRETVVTPRDKVAFQLQNSQCSSSRTTLSALSPT